MLTRCPDCHRRYDDETQWTICHHGPLWAGPRDYCWRHDLVHCPTCKKEKTLSYRIGMRITRVLEWLSDWWRKWKPW